MAWQKKKRNLTVASGVLVGGWPGANGKEETQVGKDRKAHTDRQSEKESSHKIKFQFWEKLLFPGLPLLDCSHRLAVRHSGKMGNSFSKTETGNVSPGFSPRHFYYFNEDIPGFPVHFVTFCSTHQVLLWVV